jgi:hypothetical protein
MKSEALIAMTLRIIEVGISSSKEPAASIVRVAALGKIVWI